MELSPRMIDWSQSTSVPGIQKAMEWIMYHTFFAQFVGGETAEESQSLITAASKHSIGSILVYSAEVDVHNATQKEAEKSRKTSTTAGSSYLFADKVNETLHSIEVAAACNAADRKSDAPFHRDGSTMIAVKLSGLLQDANVLERASAALLPRESFSNPPATVPPQESIAKGSSPGLMIPTAALSDSDVGALKALWEALQLFALRAAKNGNVRILIDAEYSWYQPAIDALFESCAQKFNRIPDRHTWWRFWRQDDVNASNQALAYKDDTYHWPLIYNTYQAYLRRTPSYLAMSLERARVGNYSLGVKLVRGAYVEAENALWEDTIVPTPPGMDAGVDEAREIGASLKGEWRSPVWPTKALTDECYDMCARMLIDRVAQDVKQYAKDKRTPASIAVMFAGHNWQSSMIVIGQMLQCGLASHAPPFSGLRTDTDAATPYRNLQLLPGVRGRIHLGQLYGMADDLTYAIQCAFDPASGGDGPHVALKYIPYGDLSLVMPYLTRRAQENKSVMGDGRATREIRAVGAELWRRTVRLIIGG
jgi:proline dehydrogenase